ncbi:nitrate- and nitrite sensing domain-containing protein [Streptomyces sp. ASQP_92]|uniref:sensor histidine kinase n=1 Tax=Streptomyces sp. ASQP_92 TaxID=2979116 RepID=UPI0021BE6450|nr:nitrate- and nitrite sensing domain-containing protein [Streptomyces sp. ASQP_92]MCT9093625.1 nitrate- and nitrite sensing domain-containing protein [Streptomyces sp. ASQP_92]
MKRSRTSSATQQARGNFTPPERAAVSQPTPQTSAQDSGKKDAPGSRSRFSPRNWRVATRLNAILLIPVLVGLVMGGFEVNGSIATWRDARNAEKVANIVRAASDYGQALLNERDLTAEPLLQNKRDSDVVSKAYATSDAARAKFDEAVQGMPDTPSLKRRLAKVREAEKTLEDLRKTAYAKGVEAKNPVLTEEGYTAIPHYLSTFSNELGLGTGNITSYGRMVYAVDLAKSAESLQRSIGLHLLLRPSDDAKTFQMQVKAFNSYNYLEFIALGEFDAGGTDADSQHLKDVMTARAAKVAQEFPGAKQQADNGPHIGAAPAADGSIYNGMAAAIGEGRTPKQLKAEGITPEAWMAASTSKFDGYSEIENELVGKAVTEAGQIADDAKSTAYINGAIVVVALLAAFILAGMVARQMSRSMRRLRNAAFDVAEQRLPMLVDQLSRTEPGRVDTRVEAIPIDSTDEIGEVARAFDQVHREAVRLAAEQALLRGNVNAIFTNLSRRNQSLIEGQLTLITDLENNEADPDQLESLFKLDHLATRMRRNGENLLVLAGEEPGRRWDQPVPLVDVLRAASSEVESYERIELSGVPEAEIHGRAVTDLVHLLAELLENATTFSSPQTKVRVTATRLPDGRVMVEIHDKGIGLTAEDFADINHRLANPPTVDAAVSQRMGLFVVGRLADRHGIRVQLRPSGEQAGTTSLVMLPDPITHGGGGDSASMGDDFTVSSIIPEQHQQQPYESAPAPMRTAAELGFDDSRYETGEQGDPHELDPVNRSLMREERRAALEAQAQGGERPLFRDEVEPQQHQAYDGSYDNQQQYVGQDQSYEGSYAPQPTNGYDGSYQNQQYAPEHTGGYSQDSYAPQDGYRESAYPEGSYQEPTADQGPFEAPYAAQAPQDDWPRDNTYQEPYAAPFQPEAESAEESRGVPGGAADRVGFDRPGATPAPGHELTDAGLPRRGSPQGWTAESEQEQDQPETSDGPAGDWRSTNDERWTRAEKLREPKAGGVTPSGLPRRVPKANLVEGAAEQTPQGGPQVSRAPEDVRGRLSNLRRGVQQGRNAGSETSNTYNQER